MVFNKIPGVYLNEDVDYELSGVGSKIPVFIGKTGNTGTNDYKVDGSVALKFTNYDDANKAITAGGIGLNNELNKILKNFFEEARLKQPDDIGVPYVYVIDVGAGTSRDAWLTAVETAFSKIDASIMAFVGTENIQYTPEGAEEPVSYTVVDLAKAVKVAIDTRTHTFELWNAFFTKKDATDAQLIALTDASNGVQKSRIGIIEWDNYRFGKTVARICLTPFNQEAGFIKYRSVEAGEFPERNLTQKLALQNAGIIFNHDEMYSDEMNPRMNICLATSYAATNKPADAMFHARFIADSLLKDIYEAVYPLIKANDTASNIVKIQVKVDTVVDEYVRNGDCISFNKDTGLGTRLIAQPSNKDPYDVEIVGSIQPVNAILAIDVKEKLNTAAVYTE